MGILVNTGFVVGAASPLNEYSVRETLADRNALVTDGYAYEGMEVYCKDTKIKYRWNGTAWDEVGSGGTPAAGNIATYSLPSQLGLDDTVFSVSGIINAMKALDKPAIGMFTIRGNEEPGGVSAPTRYGILMVEINGQDVSVRFVGTNADGETYGDWVGYVEYADDGTVSNIDWKIILHDVEGISYESLYDVNINNVKKALDDLYDIAYYTALEITSFTATPAGGVFETGTTVSAPTFNWTFNNTVTNQELTDCTLATVETRTASYGSDISSDKTFTLEAEDNRTSVSKSISYKFVNPYYVGESATNVLDDTGVAALTKKVVVKGTQTVSYTTSQSYMVFAYPSSYGTIKKVIDQNGFNVTSSFVQNTVTIGTEQYYVYVSNQCTGSYSMTFSY